MDDDDDDDAGASAARDAGRKKRIEIRKTLEKNYA